MRHVWLNGRLVSEADAQISVLDRGFTLGDGLFETMRAYGRRVFRLTDHLDRLTRSASRIGLPLPEGLFLAVTETLEANRLDEAAVRLMVSRGPSPPGLLPSPEPTPTCVITARPAPQPPVTLRAATASGRLNEHAPTAGLKRLGYLDSIVAVMEAQAAGHDDALLHDTAGHVAEATASNIFVLAEGILRTPPTSCGILAGITRAAVLEIASALDAPATEESIDPDTLSTAEEAFLTSSLREVVPLTAVDGRSIGRGMPGPLTRKIQQSYADLVRRED